MRVERDDGACLSVHGASGRGHLPHDLAHLVVESELKLKDGFWGDIAAGRIFDGMTIDSGPPGVKHRRSFPRRPRGHASPVIDAEVLVEIFLAIWTGAAERERGSVRAYLDSMYSPRARSRADEITTEQIERVSARLEEVARRWRDTQMGEELTLPWPLPESWVSATSPSDRTMQKAG